MDLSDLYLGRKIVYFETNIYGFLEAKLGKIIRLEISSGDYIYIQIETEDGVPFFQIEINNYKLKGIYKLKKDNCPSYWRFNNWCFPEDEKYIKK